MTTQKKSIYKSLRKYVKPGVNFRVDECGSKYAAITLTDENNEEAYLIVRQAPNVNVADKNGF